MAIVSPYPNFLLPYSVLGTAVFDKVSPHLQTILLINPAPCIMTNILILHIVKVILLFDWIKSLIVNFV